MNELVSRQAALAEIDKNREALLQSGMTGAEHILVHYGRRVIEELPTIESKRGMWIKATGMMPPEFHGHYCCSECGNFANMKPPFGNREDLSKFCPSCGARMDRSE